MKTKHICAALSVAPVFAILTATVVAAADKYTVRVPDGLAISEFKGYESWELVSVSHPVGGEGGSETLNVIVANPTMIRAYADGIPGNGKPFPDGAKAGWGYGLFFTTLRRMDSSPMAWARSAEPRVARSRNRRTTSSRATRRSERGSGRKTSSSLATSRASY